MTYEKGALILADRLVYQVEEELGSGGMAHVYLVREKGLNKLFVLKVLDTQIAREHPVAVTAFGQEARALAQMESEHLPTVSQLGQTTDEHRAHFYTMERIAGRSLKQLVRHQRDTLGTEALRLEQALNITSQIAQGLGRVHAYGVVHCDVKPANVLLYRGTNGDTRVKIIDFGVMRVMDDPRRRTFAGTPSYAAPEQILEKAIGPAADVFALGLIVFELVTGTCAYERKGLGFEGARVRAMQPAPGLDGRSSPPGIDRSERRLPPALVTLVARMLDLEPTKRPTAYEAANALRSIARDHGPANTSSGGFPLLDVGEGGASLAQGRLSIADVSATDVDVEVDVLMRKIAEGKRHDSLAVADTVPREPRGSRDVRALLGESPPTTRRAVPRLPAPPTGPRRSSPLPSASAFDDGGGVRGLPRGVTPSPSFVAMKGAPVRRTEPLVQIRGAEPVAARGAPVGKSSAPPTRSAGTSSSSVTEAVAVSATSVHVASANGIGVDVHGGLARTAKREGRRAHDRTGERARDQVMRVGLMFLSGVFGALVALTGYTLVTRFSPTDRGVSVMREQPTSLAVRGDRASSDGSMTTARDTQTNPSGVVP